MDYCWRYRAPSSGTGLFIPLGLCDGALCSSEARSLASWRGMGMQRLLRYKASRAKRLRIINKRLASASQLAASAADASAEFSQLDEAGRSELERKRAAAEGVVEDELDEADES